MKKEYNGIRCEKGYIVRIKGLSDTVKVVFLDPSGKVVQVAQND